MAKITISPLPDNRVAVLSPYNADYVQRAREIGGRWERSMGAWVFPAEGVALVRSVLRDIYGEDDGPVERARLRVAFPGWLRPARDPESGMLNTNWHKVDEGDKLHIVVGGREIARAFDRDGGARLGADIVVPAGGFTSGGSRKNPAVGIREGTVFDILRISRPMAERLASKFPEICKLVADDGALLEGDAAATNVVPLRGGAA